MKTVTEIASAITDAINRRINCPVSVYTDIDEVDGTAVFTVIVDHVVNEPEFFEVTVRSQNA